MKRLLISVLGLVTSALAMAQIQTNAGIQYLQCMPKDVSFLFIPYETLVGRTHRLFCV